MLCNKLKQKTTRNITQWELSVTLRFSKGDYCRTFPSCCKPLFQGETKCKAVGIKWFLFSCKWHQSQEKFCAYPRFESNKWKWGVLEFDNGLLNGHSPKQNRLITNINNALVSLTCDLEISAVAESSMAPFSTNTPSPVIHVTQQITCNFHYSTRGLSSLSRGITERRNHSNESYCRDVMLFKAIDGCAINTYWRRALSYKGQTSVKCIKTFKKT